MKYECNHGYFVVNTPRQCLEFYEDGKFSHTLPADDYHLLLAHAAERPRVQAKYDGKPTNPVDVSVLIVDNKHVLLGRRAASKTAGGMWSTPGGRMERAEGIKAAAARETLEETGLSIVNPEIIHWCEHWRFGSYYIMFYLLVTKFTGQLQNLEPKKCDGWHWHSLNNWPENCTEPVEVRAKLLEAL